MMVMIPYDPYWSALEWAKEHCPSYITNKAAVTEPDDLGKIVRGATDFRIAFYFADEKDAVLFALRWS